MLFGNPVRTAVEVSPDGSHVSFLAPSNGVLNVWVAPTAEPARAAVVTQDTKRGIRMSAWAYNSRQILYLQDEAGNENWNVFSVEIAKSHSNCISEIRRQAIDSPLRPGALASWRS